MLFLFNEQDSSYHYFHVMSYLGILSSFYIYSLKLTISSLVFDEIQ